jgi:ankyrin repeat protein
MKRNRDGSPPGSNHTLDPDVLSKLFTRACEDGDMVVIELLLKSGAIDINDYMPDGFTPLHKACLRNNADVVTKLCNYPNIDVNKTKGATPLYSACEKGFTSIVNILLGKIGVDVNKSAETEDGSLLYIACEKGFIEIVRLLIGVPDIDVNRVHIPPGESFYGGTPLYIACENGFTEIVCILLEVKGIYVNGDGTVIGNTQPIMACLNNTPLVAACENGHIEVVRALLGHEHIKPDMPSRDDLAQTPLIAACGPIDCVEIVNMLLQQDGVDVNHSCKGDISSDIYTYTPLHMAFNNLEIMERLLKHPKIDPNQVLPKCNSTPIYFACLNNNTETVELLLKYGANPNIAAIKQDENLNIGGTPFFVACMNGFVEIVQMLLKTNRVDVNKEREEDKLSPIEAAYNEKQHEIIRLLIEYKRK